MLYKSNMHSYKLQLLKKKQKKKQWQQKNIMKASEQLNEKEKDFNCDGS